MAGDWMKVEKCTPDKPEVLQVARALGVSRGDAFLGCFRVWRWFDDHTTAGRASGITIDAVDDCAGKAGFANAMSKTCPTPWLIIEEDGLVLPHFDKHNGSTAKKRADGAIRVARHRRNAPVTEAGYIRNSIPRPLRREVFQRDGNACAYCGRQAGNRLPIESKADAAMGLDHVIPITQGGATTSCNLVACCGACNNTKNNRTPDEAGMQWPCDVTGKRYGSVTKALPEKRREEKKISPPTPPRGKRDLWAEAVQAMQGDELNTVSFGAAWSDWNDERRAAGRKAYTRRGVAGQIRKLEKLGHDRAIAAIRHSITEGYAGIYEPSGDSQRQGPRPAPRRRTPEDRGEYAEPGFGDD
jgi:5-methylcytosine-specific restriction endonuclease McrA